MKNLPQSYGFLFARAQCQELDDCQLLRIGNLGMLDLEVLERMMLSAMKRPKWLSAQEMQIHGQPANDSLKLMQLNRHFLAACCLGTFPTARSSREKVCLALSAGSAAGDLPHEESPAVVRIFVCLRTMPRA